MYILQQKKNIKFLDLEIKKFDLILIQLCNFLLFNLQKISFTNLSYKIDKKLDIVDMLLKLSLAVCFSKKTFKKEKNILLPQSNVFKFQTDGFDLLYDAHARKMKFTKYFVGWFMGQQSKRYHNFYGVRKYVYHQMLKQIKGARKKNKEELFARNIEIKKKRENILYRLFTRFQKKGKKKVRFFERKLYLRMRRQWIDYGLIKIQRGILKMRKFYVRNHLLKKTSVLHFFDKKTKIFKFNILNQQYRNLNFYKTLFNEIKTKEYIQTLFFRKKPFVFNSSFNKNLAISKDFFFCKLEGKKNA